MPNVSDKKLLDTLTQWEHTKELFGKDFYTNLVKQRLVRYEDVQGLNIATTSLTNAHDWNKTAHTTTTSDHSLDAFNYGRLPYTSVDANVASGQRDPELQKIGNIFLHAVRRLEKLHVELLELHASNDTDVFYKASRSKDITAAVCKLHTFMSDRVVPFLTGKYLFDYMHMMSLQDAYNEVLKYCEEA